MTEQDFLTSYNIKDFDSPLCTVDMAILAVDEGELKILLVKRSDHPFQDRWALPGGFTDPVKDSTIEDTAFRKLYEKTGLRSPYLEQVATIGNAGRDPRGWAVTILYFALVDYSLVNTQPDFLTNARSEWVAMDDALNRNLAFDHKELIAQCINRLRLKTRYSALPINLMPQEFTLTELQRMFELVLGSNLEKKAFRFRIASSGLLEETGATRPTGRRPAALFRRGQNFQSDFIFPGLLDVHPEML